MIIEKREIHEIQGDEFDTTISSVNKNKLAKLYGILSGIYRNPIGAIVREYGSNAHDANIEAANFNSMSYNELCDKYTWITNPEMSALNMTEDEVAKLKSSFSKVGKNEPVIIGIDNSESPCFYVQDYGIGLSPNRMKHIYFNYLDSTKEDNDLEIGGFGIGAKSALSYTHTFFITTVYKGTQYEYIMTKDKMGIPNGQLLNKIENCNKSNGTLIKVPIKDDDIDTFSNEITRQLAYMPNVYYKNINYTNWESDNFNDSKIIVGDTWKTRTGGFAPMNQLHISLENVTYSIDWTEIGMNSINVPFALIFKTGELQPAPSRESVVYDKLSIELIKTKINNFVMSIVDKYNSINRGTDDFEFWSRNKDNSSKIISLYDKDDINVTVEMRTLLLNFPNYSANNLNTVTYKPFDELGFKKSNIPGNLFFDYKPIRFVDCNSGRSSEKKWMSMTKSFIDLHKYTLVNAGEKSVHVKNCYILEEILNSNRDFYFLRREKKKLKKYISELNLGAFPKGEWREKIKGYQDVIENIIASKNSLGDYNSIHINPNWHKSYKSGNSVYSPQSSKILRGDDEIYTKIYDGYSWNKENLKMSYIQNFTGIILYDVYDNRSDLIDIHKMLRVCNTFKYPARIDSGLKVITVSKTNCKKLKEMENTFTPQELLSGEIRTVKRVVTAYKVRDRIEKLSLFEHFEDINKECYNLYSSLKDYVNGNSNLIVKRWNDTLDSKFLEGLMKIADKLNLYDQDIIHECSVLEDYLQDIDIIRFLDYHDINESQENRNILVKYLKSVKKKVNNIYYLKTPFNYLEELIQKPNIYEYN